MLVVGQELVYLFCSDEQGPFGIPRFSVRSQKLKKKAGAQFDEEASLVSVDGNCGVSLDVGKYWYA